MLAQRNATRGSESATRAGIEAIRLVAPGVALTLVVAAGALAAGAVLPAVGAPLIAIVAGAVVATARPVPQWAHTGVSFCSRRVLQASIVVLASGLSLGEVFTTGLTSLPVLVGTLALALVLARPVGRALGLPRDVTTLVGVGTAICGASAIAAADSVIEADGSDVAYSVTTIFLFNVVALLLFPVIGHVLGLSQHTFGVWAGTAVNDLSSVVATSTLYGHAAQSTAVVVKLTRTLAIIPVCVGLAWLRRPQGAPTRGPDGVSPPTRRIVPMFLLGFLIVATANSVGAIPVSWHFALARLSTWMITAALAAVGLSTRPDAIRRAGWRPVALGAVLWAAVAVSGLALQGLTGLLR